MYTLKFLAWYKSVSHPDLLMGLERVINELNIDYNDAAKLTALKKLFERVIELEAALWPDEGEELLPSSTKNCVSPQSWVNSPHYDDN